MDFKDAERIFTDNKIEVPPYSPHFFYFYYDKRLNAAETAAGSVKSGESAGVWIVGMRYKLLDANTTEQVAQGYFEDKMEVGATSGSFLGVSEAQTGGVTLDTLVQRLVQQSVAEIDQNYK